jgi:hypothetical protein
MTKSALKVRHPHIVARKGYCGGSPVIAGRKVPVRAVVNLALTLGLILFANQAYAQAAFQFAAPGVRVPDSPTVSGLRFSVIHGKNQGQRGLDLGLLSMSETSNFSGLALICGISRVTRETSGGAAFSLVNWHSSRDSGMNGAFINILNDTEDAFNLGFVTVANGGTAVDLGGFNMSRSSTAQIGFVNVTDKIKTFQFGFLNIAKNGFLPVFPIFNFPKR